MVSGEEDLIVPLFTEEYSILMHSQNCQQKLTFTYRKHGNIKKRAYEQSERDRIWILYPTPICRPDLQYHYGLVKMPTIFLSIAI